MELSRVAGDLPNQLPSLETLQIFLCKQLGSSLPRAPAISYLAIEGDNKVRMQELPLSLRYLSIPGSHLVESVLEANTQTQLTCLSSLVIFNCSSAISFPVACIPASLHELRICRCRKLEFQMQGQHDSLWSLVIIDSCDSHTSFSLDAFPNLVCLQIRRCVKMSLVVSQSLSKLRTLSIDDCPSFISFSTLWMAAPQLERLTIMGCPEIDSFPVGGPHCSLRDLCISHCEKLVSCLASMNSHSHRLTNLRIEGACDNVKSFPKEGCLPASLESLELSGIPSLETLDCKGLVHLTSLQQLTIRYCHRLKNMEGERLPASLIRLFIYKSPLLGKRCETKDPEIWPKISHIRGIQIDGRWIW